MAQKMEAIFHGLIQQTGNTWLPFSFLNKCGFNEETLKEAVKRNTIQMAWKDEIPVFTLNQILEQEKRSCLNVLRLSKVKMSETFNHAYINKIIDRIELEKKVKLHQNQREAVIKAVDNSFLVLTGGPGTGKTFVINFIKEVHQKLYKDCHILFAAPSGKAAKRITESIGNQSSTVHSLLGITPDHLTPVKLSKKTTLLVIDEVSMLDLQIFDLLLQAIETGTKVLLVGDTDQLPSVGPGAVLRDLIASDVISVAKLTATFRQAGDSILFDNIQRIKNADYHLIAGNDFQLATIPKGLNGQEVFLWLYSQQAKQWGAKNVLGLTPFRKAGEVSANSCNNLIQQMENPVGAYVEIDKLKFRKGDPVMQLRNELAFSNGDIGYVVDIAKNTICVKYPEVKKLAYYSPKSVGEITLAYCMSIHKSQGSEAPSIVTALLPEHKKMAERNILYTAITRAKKIATLLYDKETLIQAIEQESSTKRITMLKELLQYGNSQL